jgi:hypothetical protein
LSKQSYIATDLHSNGRTILQANNSILQAKLSLAHIYIQKVGQHRG